METPRTFIDPPASGAFAERVGVELNRAERYRVFVSLTVLDLKVLKEMSVNDIPTTMQSILKKVNSSIRACDYAALVGEHDLALLFPETPRQGAEIASRRLADIVRDSLRELSGLPAEGVIPVEIASYPDTAGAKTLTTFLEDLLTF